MESNILVEITKSLKEVDCGLYFAIIYLLIKRFTNGIKNDSEGDNSTKFK